MRSMPFIRFIIIFTLFQSAIILQTTPALSTDTKGTILTTYREQYQDAFSILIPKGWKAEGGMIPSGVPWNVVDLVESNIRFRVTSPDGKSFFGWYPRF